MITQTTRYGLSIKVTMPYETAVERTRDGVKKVLDDESLRVELVKAGFENSERFNWQAIAGQFLKLYRSIAS